MAGQEDELPFPLPESAPIQSRLKVFIANWLHNPDLVESCRNEGFFTGDANGTRRLHYTQRIPVPTISTTDPSVYDHSSLPRDNSGLKCVEVSIYTEKGLAAAKPRGKQTDIFVARNLVNFTDGHNVPPEQRYQLAQPGLENDRSALRCYNIIAEVTFYASVEPKVIYRTIEGNALVKWEAQISRGWTNPRDDKDVMHLALNSWTGENGILELIQAQAELEALWISAPPHVRISAIAEGNVVAARRWADVAMGLVNIRMMWKILRPSS